LNNINFDKTLHAGFSIYGSIISRIADSALTLGLNVSEAQRKNRIYNLNLEAVLKNLKNRFFELVEDGVISSQAFKSWREEALHQLFYSDFKKLIAELRQSVTCQDNLVVCDVADEESLSKPSEILDEIRDEFQEMFLSKRLSKPEKRMKNLKSYGIYGDIITLIPQMLSVILGVSLHADGRTRAVCAVVGNSKNTDVSSEVNSWVFENDEWHFENTDGERLLQASSGRGGGFIAVYRKENDEREAIRSCLNQLREFAVGKNWDGV
jgi:hypothetical protein